MPSLKDQQSDQHHKRIQQHCLRVRNGVNFRVSRLIRPIDDRVVVWAVSRVVAVAVEATHRLMAGFGNDSKWSRAYRCFARVM